MPADSKEHWLLTVARAANLPGVGDLEASPDVKTVEVWARLTEAAEISGDDLAQLIADRYVMRVADLGTAEQHAARLLPAIVAVRYQVLPLRYTDRTLDVATADPHDVEAEREISRLATRAVRFEIAPPDLIREGLAHAYAGAARPRAGRDGTLTGRPEAAPDQRRKPSTHVLVVDDDPGTGELLRTFLEGKGFRVTSVESGPAALERIAMDDTIDIVSLDYYMQPMNGLKVLKTVRTELGRSELPVVMLTSSEDRNIEMSLFEAGADDYVVKPLDPPRFFLRLKAVLRRRGAA